jgi:hypothetical protein
LEASKRQLADLERTYRDLLDKNQDLRREHQEVLDNLSKQLDESEKKARAFRIQVGRLQGHLTKNATNANELVDSEVKAKLEIIQARTQSLVMKYCVGRPKPPKRQIEKFAELDNDWLEKSKFLSSRFSPEDVDVFRTHWVRSQIYMLLEKRIFNSKVFGLEPDLDKSFAEFEGLIVKHSHGKIDHRGRLCGRMLNLI